MNFWIKLDFLLNKWRCLPSSLSPFLVTKKKKFLIPFYLLNYEVKNLVINLHISIIPTTNNLNKRDKKKKNFCIFIKKSSKDSLNFWSSKRILNAFWVSLLKILQLIKLDYSWNFNHNNYDQTKICAFCWIFC